MRRSESRLRGIGEQVVKILACELRDISELPDEVEIVGTISTPPQGTPSEWYPPVSYDQFPHIVMDTDRKYVYLHIRSRYAVRRPNNSALMIEDFETFLDRWNSMWKDKK